MLKTNSARKNFKARWRGRSRVNGKLGEAKKRRMDGLMAIRTRKQKKSKLKDELQEHLSTHLIEEELYSLYLVLPHSSQQWSESTII
tara:strand:- start:259 stop:519 length:261 start_codon:yes stop_codon:yes gene_type:complete